MEKEDSSVIVHGKGTEIDLRDQVHLPRRNDI